MGTINIGFGNVIMANRVISILSPESAPIKRMVSEAKRDGELIDATYGRKTRSVIITDSRQLILSSVQVDTLSNRVE